MGTSQSKTEEFKQQLKGQLEIIYPSPKDQIIKIASQSPTKPAPQNLQKVELNAKPIKEINENRVNAFDRRIQVLETSKWPYSVHGLVSMKFPNADCCGTGIMIGPNIVLTAGHNLYSHRHKAYADLQTMQFLPGMNGQQLPFGAVEVGEYFVSPKYIEEEKEDYGILILKEPIGEMTGYFGLACLEPEEMKKKRINVTGYPGDKVASKPNIYEMWGMEGEASHIDEERGLVNYLIDTDPGQSGSGVWYQEEGDFYVCGVHVLGSVLVNKATRITRAIYEQIYAWLHQVNFNEKLFELRDYKLDFYSRGIGTECLPILMRYSLNNMRVLDLSHNKIDAEGAKILAKNTSWTNLSNLDLRGNYLGAEGAKALAQNTSWIKLDRLSLGLNNIGTEGVKALAQNTSWENLTLLDVGRDKIGEEGVKALVKNTSWRKLRELSIRVSAEGEEMLTNNKTWYGLRIWLI